MGIPTDRESLRALYEEHGSWSAVARFFKVKRSSIDHLIRNAGLMGAELDRSRARLRLAPEHQWMLNKDDLRRKLQQYGSPNQLSRATGVGTQYIHKYAEQHGLSPEDWVPDPADYGVKRYDKPLVLTGDWAIASDFQAPFTDRKMVQLLCKIGKAWNIKNLLIPGDFLDLQHFAKFDPLDEPPDWETTKTFCKTLLRTLGENFPGEKVWSAGNHELRITRLTKGRFTIQELASAVEATEWRVVQTPLVQIQTPRGIWDIIHPKSFSIMPTSVGKDFAHKHRHHVMIAHGHGVGYRRDYSGESECLDLGGMFDPAALSYSHLFPSRYPVMRQGFALLVKGHAYLIQNDSDIDFWVKAGKVR